MEGSNFKKRLALMLGIILLIGLIPLSATAEEGIGVIGMKDATGVTATLNNPSLEDVNAIVIIAVYKENGALSKVKEFPVTVKAGSFVNQRLDYDVYANMGYTYKVFAWDPDYVPLCSDAVAGNATLLCVTVDGSDAVCDGLFVTASPEVTEFIYVRVDQVKKIGTAYTAAKSGSIWTHTRVSGADIIIAYKPASIIGGALPVATMTYLDTRVSNNANKIRIVISL